MPVFFKVFGKKPAQKKKAWVIFFLSMLQPNLKLTYQTIRSKVYNCMKPMRITKNKDTRMVIGEGKHKWRTGHNWLCLAFFQLKGWCAFFRQITKFSKTRVKQFRIASKEQNTLVYHPLLPAENRLQNGACTENPNKAALRIINVNLLFKTISGYTGKEV